jgi:rhodanese-related sulfurtransferase
MIKSVTRGEVQARIAANPSLVLLEALPAKYYDDGHLPGAKHFPHDRARELAATVVPDKATEIVVYCASGTCQNSHIAARVLEQIGYTNLAVYAGGKQDWLEGGARLETGREEATIAA